MIFNGLVLLTFAFLASVQGQQCVDKDSEKLLPKDPIIRVSSSSPKFSCNTKNIDAATVTAKNETFFFKGAHCWKTEGKDVVPGYPRLITSVWTDAPSDVDCAVTLQDGRMLFFKEDQYWSYQNPNRLDQGYPKKIGKGFCGIPDKVEACFVSRGLLYFIKDGKIWSYDFGSCKPASEAKDVKSWNGMPEKPDDVFVWTDGATYFVKDDSVYKYADNKSAKADPIKFEKKFGYNCDNLQCLSTRYTVVRAESSGGGPAFPG